MDYEEAAASSRQRAWASCSAGSTPVPSHHGQATSLGDPPRFEITRPVPRQGGQGRGSSGASALTAGARVPSRG